MKLPPRWSRPLVAVLVLLATAASAQEPGLLLRAGSGARVGWPLGSEQPLFRGWSGATASVTALHAAFPYLAVGASIDYEQGRLQSNRVALTSLGGALSFQARLPLGERLALFAGASAGRSAATECAGAAPPPS